jgi:hypothetical protein
LLGVAPAFLFATSSCGAKDDNKSPIDKANTISFLDSEGNPPVGLINDGQGHS